MKYFDTHCDTVSEACVRALQLDSEELLAGVRPIGDMDARAQFLALFIGAEDSAPWQTYCRYRDYYIEQIGRLAALARCNSKEDLEKAAATGKCAGFLTVENARTIEGDVSRAAQLAVDGVKAVTLTWNAENEFACGAAADGPLKARGVALVRELERLGIVTDVSHLCDASLNDLLRRFDLPVAATHSNLRRLCAHKRNLTDDQFREIAARGGVVGLNFYEPFLQADGRASLDDLLRQTDAMLELGGEGSVCIGADFDGGGTAPFCADVSGIPALYAAFAPRFGQNTADAIFYGNAVRFFLGE
ncbi:MAG: membrane dipeptidase [Oscillospiraceae bacterium]|nr:membrane dipeptidase [Oscillospiraceae bacterium]